MKFAPDDNTSREMAHENLRCVWMTAGILSYQLCDRQFDCDRCPLDAAMRMHFSKRPDAATGNQGEKEQVRQLFYSRNHCWIESLPDGRARVGIEPEFAAALLSLKAVVLPAVHEKIRHDEWCAWIVLDDGTLPLRAPVSGSVSAVNARLAEHPSAISTSPFDDGWLYEVELKSDEHVRSHLMKKADAQPKFAGDVLRFRKSILAALNESSKMLGATLHDGGELAADASVMVGGKRYVELVREAFHC